MRPSLRVERKARWKASWLSTLFRNAATLDSNRFPAHYESAARSRRCCRRRLPPPFAFDKVTLRRPFSVKEARNDSGEFLIVEQYRGLKHYQEKRRDASKG
jgi:hypothetical protein